MKSIRYFIEYLFVRACWGLLACVPSCRVYGVGAVFGQIWFALDARRRRTSIDNLLCAHIAVLPQEARRIARRSFQHFVGAMLESIRAPQVITRENWREHVEFEAPAEAISLLLTPDQPLLLVTAHLGCWEIAGLWASLFRPLYALARPMNNPRVQHLVQSQFRTDLTVLPKDDGYSPALLRTLEERKAGLAIVMDQHAGRSGIWMDVLGRPASVHSSPARLHLRTGFPLLFGCFVRTGPLRYRMIFTAPIFRDKAPADREKTRALVEELTRRLEPLIRRYPEQYLWMHRRWRTPPVGQ